MMKRVPLGQSGMTVSALCLGTMTWGNQVPEAVGHAQADMALAAGIDFWDTAEMYPTASSDPATVGDTERVIGRWLASRGGRDRIVLASKVTARGQRVRPGECITPANLRLAVEGSLRRLGTDYIDLYQIHWPDRGSYHFRQHWSYAPVDVDRAEETRRMGEFLMTADALVREGKIRAIGVSNETVWGTARWLHVADTLGLPRMMTVQNEYSLICRQFDTDWAEMSIAENMPLLAYSPLATGILSGKYSGDVIPAATRRTMTPELGGRLGPRALAAADAYVDLAARHGIDPCQMAIAFCLARPFPTIPIIGATTIAQLETDIAAAGVTLGDEVLAGIDAIHREYPLPF